MRKLMFRLLQDIFVLQEERKGRQEEKLLSGNQSQDRVSSA